MCRLLSTIGKPKGWTEIILEFQKQADTGAIPPLTGIAPGHKDSWGMAKSKIDTSGMEIVGKYLGSAMEANEYKNNVESLSETPYIFMCHLRKATPGIQISLANAHPFRWNNWAFIHNGTVYEADKLKVSSNFESTSDNSDSEKFFQLLLTFILDEESNQTVPDKIIDALLNINVPFSSVNSILSNGHELYAIRYCTRLEDYFSLLYCETREGIVISSEPINIPELKEYKWEEIPNRSIILVAGDPLKIEIFQF